MSGVGLDADVAVELLDIADLARIEPRWRDLLARAGEPNPFADSAFLIPLLSNLAPRGLRALTVWRRSDSRLLAFLVLRLPRILPGLAEVWRSEQAASPSLSLDRDHGASALAEVLSWLARENALVLGLTIPDLDLGGSTISALRATSGDRRLRLELLNPRKRAALAHIQTSGFEASLDPKRRKEWRRQRRRLEDGGEVSFSWSADGAAVEAFLALEGQGWKGSRGTALASDAARAAFTRDMLTAFSRRGDARIARLDRGGRTIAAGVVLRAGSRAYYWKTAYDESLAAYSPGVQLTIEISRSLEADSGIELTDSCAIPDHPMIDRLWPGRLELVDAAIAARPGASRGLSLALVARDARKRAREGLKRRINARLGR